MGQYLQQQYRDMFSKLINIKNFITQAITSLPSQQPHLPYDSQLPQKLHFFTNHIMTQEVELQFKAYHQLQNPEITLNEILEQLYYSKEVDTASVIAILGFYTFILNNCHNQLILCKIVSNSFVIDLTKAYYNKLHEKCSDESNPLLQMQQINPYKIALVKAYISKINEETIKYMILGQRMPILENCISCLLMFLQSQRGELGIEATCMSNSILLIIKFISSRQEYYSACFQEGQGGLYYLFQRIIIQVHNNMLEILKDEDKFKIKIEDITSKILFIIDLLEHITNHTYRTRVIAITSKELQNLKGLYTSLMQYFTTNQDKIQYKRVIELIKILVKLLTLYFDTEQLKETFQSTIIIILDEFVVYLKRSIDSMLQKLGAWQQDESKKDRMGRIDSELKGLMNSFCSNSQILMMVVLHGNYFSRRNVLTQQEINFNIILINKIIEIIETILNEHLPFLLHHLCYKAIKLLLLSFMQLSLGHNFTFHEYTILKLHQHSISSLKDLLKRNEEWDYVVENYESLVKMVNGNLLKIGCVQANEYQFCQYHDLYKNKRYNNVEYITDAILIDECIRNFRFMIVEKTYLPIKHIKLQKHYHVHFITPGWNYEPGTIINEGEVVEFMFELIHLSNGVKVPINVIRDDQCLIFVHREQGQPKKIILNIRYKMMEGMRLEKEQLKIQLKGAQEIITEGKVHLQKFKNYLIQKKDRTRQRQLKFIHQNLDVYYGDNQKMIGQIGDRQMQQLQRDNTVEGGQQVEQRIVGYAQQSLKSGELEQCIVGGVQQSEQGDGVQ